MAILIPYTRGEELKSSCQSENNGLTMLDMALQSLRDNSVIDLRDECNTLTQYILIRNLSNITLSAGNDSDTIITCVQGIGLTFFNISNLTIENVVIENCNLNSTSDGHLPQALAVINDTINPFYRASKGLQVSVLMADIKNLTMNQVVIRDNRGIGLLAINVMNESSISNVIFANNTPNECVVAKSHFLNFTESIAGGMFLYYSDYKDRQVDKEPSLTISKSDFRDNQYCSLSGAYSSLSVFSPSIESIGYIYGGGSGLGLALSQFNFSVNVTVEHTNFQRNYGLLGSLYITQFQGSHGSRVLIDDCLFDENGLNSEKADNFMYHYGGAATMLLNVAHNQNLRPEFEVEAKNLFYFKDTVFSRNTAFAGGGIYMIALASSRVENEFIFNNSVFKNNMATLSSAIQVYERKDTGLEPGINVIFHNISVEDNSNPFPDDGIQKSAITAVSMNVTFSGNSILKVNKATPLLSLSSVINLRDDVLFDHNSGVRGGAIYIDSVSYLVIHNNTRVGFINNSATNAGGAIYTAVTAINIIFACLLSFHEIDIFCNFYDFNCTNPGTLNIKVTFNGNTAPLGSDIYGNIINNCSWLLDLQLKYPMYEATPRGGLEILNYLSQKPNSNFSFVIPLNTDRAVNTDVLYLDTAHSEGSSSDNRISLFPGQVANVNISAKDAFFQNVPLGITSTVVSGEAGSRSQLGLSGYWFLSGRNDQNLTQLSVYGTINSNVTVSINSGTTIASTMLYIELNECLYGFIYDGVECICDPNLLNGRNFDTFECSVATGSITVPRFFWLGRTPVDEYTFQECILDYCRTNAVTINGEHSINDQCAYNRRGILCGECNEGYSVVFGSNRCKKCKTDGRIFGLIIGFLVAGVFLVLAIVFLNFTVSEGYLNGVIFYANITSFFITILSQLISSGAASIFFFISWINFEPGFETCIYNGMNALTRSAFSLFFPFYLFFLMLIIIYLARRSKKIASFGFSATRAFATLLLLCYSSVARTCFELLSYKDFIGSNGEKYVGWYTDPNVKFGKDLHGFMVFLAIFLLIFYVIPFAIILTCPLRYLNKTRCGRFITIKYKPVFDAFYSPFKEKFTFWIGFRCIIRMIPLAISGVSSYPDNVFGITVFIGIFLFLHEIAQPFVSKQHNKLETFFLVNLLLIALGVFYYPQKREYFDVYTSTAYITILVLLAYAGITYIGLLHINIRFPQILPSMKLYLKNKCCRCKCCSCCLRCCCYKKEPSKSDDKESEAVTYESTNATSLLPPPLPTFSELREPLLESGNIELVTVKKK